LGIVHLVPVEVHWAFVIVDWDRALEEIMEINLGMWVSGLFKWISLVSSTLFAEESGPRGRILLAVELGHFVEVELLRTVSHGSHL